MRKWSIFSWERMEIVDILAEEDYTYKECDISERREIMIYTVTFNPSLDYIVDVKNLSIGKMNRTSYERMLPGGKGINVSTVLTNLGVANKALGFIAGFTGKEIERLAKESGMDCDFICLGNGNSRIGVKIRNYAGTEINGMGPVISSEAMDALMEKLKQAQSGDVIVLAGHIPGSMSDTIYQDIMKELGGKGIEFVVDATKDLLRNVLKHRPFLIKPNNLELGELFGVSIHTKDEVVLYAKRLQQMGARNILVSMAAEGAVLLNEAGEVYVLPAPEGEVCNAVGAGDSMVAGFLAGWQERQDSLHALKMGLSAGSASAFSEVLATKEEIEGLFATYEC